MTNPDHLIRPHKYALEVLQGQSARKQTSSTGSMEGWVSGILEGREIGVACISLDLKTATGYRIHLSQRHYDAIGVTRDGLIIPMNVRTEKRS